MNTSFNLNVTDSEFPEQKEKMKFVRLVNGRDLAQIKDLNVWKTYNT